MPNIFDGIKKVSEEDLREQIAILETFTMTNLSKQTGQKVAKKLVEATNLVTGIIKKAPFQAPEVLSIQELIEQNKLQWQMLERPELEKHLQNVLKTRCNSLNPGTIDEDTTEDALSIFVIEQATQLYELKEELLPSQKADFIAKAYEEEVKERQQASEKDEDTSETLQIPLGKNKLIRELFVKLIALSVEACGGQLSVKEEDLPSWLPSRERYEREQAYQVLMTKHNRNEENYKNALQRLLENDQEISSKRKRIEHEENKQQEIKLRLEKLVAEKDALLNKLVEHMDTLVSTSEESILEQLQQIELEEQRVAKEVKMKEAQIASYEGMLSMSEEEIESATKYIDVLNRKKEEDITYAVKKAIANKDETAERVQSEKEEREKSLENRWQTVYDRFKFEEECLRVIHDTFVSYELIDLERALLELHSAQDIEALSWGEVDEKDYAMFGIHTEGHILQHILFSLASGVVAILIYEILEEAEYKARIVKILKVNE